MEQQAETQEDPFRMIWIAKDAPVQFRHKLDMRLKVPEGYSPGLPQPAHAPDVRRTAGDKFWRIGAQLP